MTVFYLFIILGVLIVPISLMIVIGNIIIKKSNNKITFVSGFITYSSNSSADSSSSLESHKFFILCKCLYLNNNFD